MTILIVIALTILIITFVLYNVSIYVRHGILDSISESYYALKDENKALWLGFCWIGLVLPMVLITAATSQDFFFVSAIGFAFVGAAGMFKLEEMTAAVHYVGAGLGITAAFIALAHVPGFWILPLAFIIISGVFYFIKLKHIIYWIEMVAFGLIIFGLLMNKF